MDAPKLRNFAVFLFGAIFVSFAAHIAQSRAADGQSPESSGENAAAREADSGFIEAIKDLVDEAASTAGDDLQQGDGDLTAGSRGAGVRAGLQLQEYLDQYENFYTGATAYNFSMRNVIGAQVSDSAGLDVGKVHDVIVERDTGEASLLIVDSGGTYYDSQLKALRFSDVFQQNKDGRATLTLDQADLQQRADFRYDNAVKTNYVSLRSLQTAEFLDPNGAVIGDVESVLYENAEAQRLYFSVKPDLSASGQEEFFSLPYEAVDVVESPDGYDIVLNRAQIESLNLQDEQ